MDDRTRAALEDMLDELHQEVQFYDERGNRNNFVVLDLIRKTLIVWMVNKKVSMVIPATETLPVQPVESERSTPDVL